MGWGRSFCTASHFLLSWFDGKKSTAAVRPDRQRSVHRFPKKQKKKLVLIFQARLPFFRSPWMHRFLGRGDRRTAPMQAHT
jgi:hypothetical protein